MINFADKAANPSIGTAMSVRLSLIKCPSGDVADILLVRAHSSNALSGATGPCCLDQCPMAREPLP